MPVTVQAAGIGRFPQDTEAAVCFCCLEALQNTAKYARATAARITLSAADGALTFAVSDDGAGYDSARAGTTVTGELPSRPRRGAPVPPRRPPW